MPPFEIQPFELTYLNTVLFVRQVDMQDRLAFQVRFSSARKPLLVVRAIDFNGVRFWTSMPEGRQKEAEGVGAMIEEYISSQNIQP